MADRQKKTEGSYNGEKIAVAFIENPKPALLDTLKTLHILQYPYTGVFLLYILVHICTTYVVGSKSFRPDQLFKVTKQLCYFST